MLQLVVVTWYTIKLLHIDIEARQSFNMLYLHSAQTRDFERVWFARMRVANYLKCGFNTKHRTTYGPLLHYKPVWWVQQCPHYKLTLASFLSQVWLTYLLCQSVKNWWLSIFAMVQMWFVWFQPTMSSVHLYPMTTVWRISCWPSLKQLLIVAMLNLYSLIMKSYCTFQFYNLNKMSN